MSAPQCLVSRGRLGRGVVAALVAAVSVADVAGAQEGPVEPAGDATAAPVDTAPAPSPSATLSGVIRDRDTLAPIEGIAVGVEGGPTTTTGPDGRFLVEGLTPGAVPVRLEGPGANAITTEEVLAPGEHLEVVYELEGPAPPAQVEADDDLEIVVVAPTLGHEVVSTRIVAEEARRAPGTQGDALRVVENLPGVARSSVGTGQLVVWGAAPEDTRVYVDGVPIPRLYHEGGLRSVVASDLVTAVDLVPGGYGAAYGRGLGGLVRVETAIPTRPGLHGAVSADLYDASAMLHGDAGEDVTLAAAARVSWIHALVEATRGDLGDYVPVPRYWDAQVRGRVALAPGEVLDLVVLGGGDRISRGVPNDDPAQITQERREVDFQRVFGRWERQGPGGSLVVVTPWLGWERSARLDRFGAVETSTRAETFSVGLRASGRNRLAPWLTVEGGVDAEVASHRLEREGSLGLPPREGDARVFGQPPPDQVAADDWRVVDVSIAPYVEADLAFADDRVHVVPGLRLDPFVRNVSRRTPVEGDAPDVGLASQSFVPEPRLALRWQAADALALHAAGGLYNRFAAPGDVSAAFGNPALPPARAWHALAGVSVSPAPSLRFEVTGFASFTRALAVRNEVESPPRAEALVPEGWGRAYGAQALVRLERTAGWAGWIAYTLQRAERQDSAGRAWRLFDFDQTHVFTALLTWSSSGGFDVGARLRYATGAPRTPVIDATYDARRDRWQPSFGGRNAERLPDFLQFDVRLGQTFDLGDTELEVWLEVQNVTNRANAEDYAYAPDYSERDVIQSLPILPVAGLRWTF